MASPTTAAVAPAVAGADAADTRDVLLQRLAESKEFLDATANGVSGKRMADRECGLRFLAFVTTPYTEYQERDIDVYLNEKMAELNGMSDNELAKLECRFSRAMRAAKRIFGDDAFRKRYTKDAPRNPINKALFETWAVGLDSCTDGEIERLVNMRDQVKAEFMRLLNNDPSFEIAISLGTGDPAKVRARFRAIEELIRKLLI